MVLNNFSVLVRALSPPAPTTDGRPGSRSAGEVLGDQKRGFQGTVVSLDVGAVDPSGGITPQELERRLLEMGFVEGARVEILHEGAFGRDPIAVRLDDMRVALRRREARCVGVRAETPS